MKQNPCPHGVYMLVGVEMGRPDTTEQLTLKQFPAHGTCSINIGRVNEHIVLPMFLTSSLPILGVALWDFTGYCLYARTSASPKFISLWACLPLCNPMDCSSLDFSVHGIHQTRILEWVAIPFSRRSSQPRDGTHVSCTGREILYC